MSAVVGIAWTLFGITAILLSFFSAGFMKYYASHRESKMLVTSVSVTTVAIVLWTVALLPIDIFLVSSTVDKRTGLKKVWADDETVYWMTLTVQIMYYVLYGFMVGFLFFVVPFSYFYYDHEDRPSQHRGIKYMSVSAIGIVLLFLFGLFLKPNILPPHIDLDWFKYLLTESHGAKAVWFTIGCLFIPGMIVMIIYTAPGLSMIAFHLIKGKRKIDVEDEDIHHRLMHIREQQKSIEHKYAGNNKVLSVHDDRTLKNLNDEERILVRRLEGIQDDKTHLLQRILKVLKPFQVLIGLCLIIVLTLIFISVFMSNIDKLSFSVCGRKCGYITSQVKLINPMNFILVHLEKLFPIDYIAVIGIMLYFLMATMTGIVEIGILLLYRIKKASTTPKGLLVSSIFLSLGLLAFNYSMTSIIAPGYTHYGNQVYCNHTEGGQRNCTEHVDEIFPCDIYAPIEICTPTVSSTLMDRITLNTPVFGFILFYSQWIFLLSCIIGFFICLFKPRRDVEEERGLLDDEEHQ